MHATNTPDPTTATPEPAPASIDAAATQTPTSAPSLASPQPANSAPQPVASNSKRETARARARWARFVRRRGRPTLLTEEVADAMYEAILDFGVTDSRAALLAHVSTSTVSRWKQEDPIFADFLETARTEFECGEVTKIRNARRRDGQFNPQNSRWLLERTNPETWSRHATKRLTAASQPQPAQNVRQPHGNANAQQSNLAPNIPENRQQVYEAQQTALARAVELAAARFHAAQQSKSSSNIPEIPHPASPTPPPEPQPSAQHIELPPRSETTGDRQAPLAARIAPAAPSTAGIFSPAAIPPNIEEFFASFSSQHAA